MHGAVTGRRPRPRDEQGAVAIIVALFATVLLVIAALVVDLGLVRVDRQIDKSAADAATTAGLHALNGGDANPRPFVGVCTAIKYLQRNNDRFAALTDTAGSWTDGNGNAVGNGCTDAALRNQVCSPGSLASWARFTWTGSLEGQPLSVVIQSGYVLSASSGFPEDSLPAAALENNDSAQGCDQLAVIINQQRQPGLGSLATDAALKTAIRSVGRVKQEPGGFAPAMLLLERDTCPVLESGSSSGSSFIHVLGAVSTNGQSQPGTIHSDSSASSSCSGGSNQNIFLGRGSDGIVAYAAPTVGNPTVPDPTKPGQITSYAGSIGKAMNYIIDTVGTLSNAYAASGVSAAAPGTHTAPSGMPRVTRSPVDQRYFPGVKGAIASANSVFGTVTAVSPGWVPLLTCAPNQATIDALGLTATSKLYVDCPGDFQGPNSAPLTINAGTIVFRGNVAPRRVHTYPNAHHIYIGGTTGGDAISIGNNAGLKVHTAGRTDGSGRCLTNHSTSKAIMFVKAGRFRESNGGQLQLCNTSVIMMGSRSDGCVPAAAGANPSATPCTGVNGGVGDGQLLQQGGDIDWTAPDALDLTLDADGNPTAAATTGWGDINGPEDLALWAESASGGTGTDVFRMQGGGVFKVRGVFMVPNAIPFTIGGSASLNLVNAQFIVRTIVLNGTNTKITMSVDGNSAVRLPRLTIVGLVR